MMLWGMMFYHASVVHVIGIATVAAVTLIWQEYFLGMPWSSPCAD